MSAEALAGVALSALQARFAWQASHFQDLHRCLGSSAMGWVDCIPYFCLPAWLSWKIWSQFEESRTLDSGVTPARIETSPCRIKPSLYPET